MKYNTYQKPSIKVNQGKYLKKFDIVSFNVPKGTRDAIRSTGYPSTRAFLKDALYYYLSYMKAAEGKQVVFLNDHLLGGGSHHIRLVIPED